MLTIMFNLSLLTFLNFNIIPIAKVSVNSDTLPESIQGYNSYPKIVHYMWRLGTRWTPHILIV